MKVWEAVQDSIIPSKSVAKLAKTSAILFVNTVRDREEACETQKEGIMQLREERE